MLITVINRPNSVRFEYNSLAGAPQMGFSKTRTIMKSAVLSLKLSSDESYVEVIYLDQSQEQFVFSIFEGYTSNSELFEALDAMIN